jgi:hypothetical protein
MRLQPDTASGARLLREWLQPSLLPDRLQQAML